MKKSKFNFCYKRDNNENIIYNTFSKAIILLDDEEYSQYEGQEIQNENIKKELFLEIRRDYFLHKNSAIYTAKVEGVLVGAALRCNSYLDSLFVKKEYRNQKIGSTLLEKVLNDCKEYQVIRLNANIKAISLYQRYGFCQNGQIEKNLIVPMVLERK